MKKRENVDGLQNLVDSYAELKRLEVEADKYLDETSGNSVMSAVKISIDRTNAKALRKAVRLSSKVTLWAINKERAQRRASVIVDAKSGILRDGAVYLN